jgi:hypothetical protein
VNTILKGPSYWYGPDIGRAVVAAGNRLKAAGFTPRFILPSTLNMAKAVQYFDEAMRVPGARPFIAELSYHRYQDTSDRALSAIRERGERFGVGTAMLEHINADYEELHKDLTIGGNSAWMQYRMAAVGANDSGGVYFTIDTTDPAHPAIKMGSRTKFLRQYFKYIRRGAQRIEANTTDPDLDPVAFINTVGDTVVVLKAARERTGVIDGLPAGTYGITYTTESDYDVSLPDVAIQTGGAVSVRMPAKGAMTVRARNPIR